MQRGCDKNGNMKPSMYWRSFKDLARILPSSYLRIKSLLLILSQFEKLIICLNRMVIAISIVSSHLTFLLSFSYLLEIQFHGLVGFWDALNQNINEKVNNKKYRRKIKTFRLTTYIFFCIVKRKKIITKAEFKPKNAFLFQKTKLFNYLVKINII